MGLFSPGELVYVSHGRGEVLGRVLDMYEPVLVGHPLYYSVVPCDQPPVGAEWVVVPETRIVSAGKAVAERLMQFP